MESWTATLVQHGYLVLATAVFLEAVGLPVPAALALLIAGGVAAHGTLQIPYALGAALIAMLAGDTLMFLLGRYTGWWLLGILCRVSLNPESCILRSADSFYRRGRTLLVIAKFIPGINTMAPPLAGSMNMRLPLFLRLDLAGCLLYIGAFFGVGFVFSGAVDVITREYHAMGQVLSWILIALIVGYAGYRAWLWGKGRALSVVEFASAADAALELAAGACVYDVRSHGYFDTKAIRIRGSRRLDPNALHQSSIDAPDERTVFVYCTCARQATSTRVARELQSILLQKRGSGRRDQRGPARVDKGRLAVEAVPSDEIAILPLFS